MRLLCLLILLFSCATRNEPQINTTAFPSSCPCYTDTMPGGQFADCMNEWLHGKAFMNKFYHCEYTRDPEKCMSEKP